MEVNLEAAVLEPSGADSAAGKTVNCCSDRNRVEQSLNVDDSQLLGAAPDGSAAFPVTKRKRGRPPRGQAKKKKEEVEESEDVCFICFDGGNLVLCDHRGCPKAYHPSCTKRDDSFFRSKMKWQCGWHICTRCQKPSHYMCYTCTFSLCKKCTRDAEYVCVRGNKGFCGLCMRPIMLIENPGQGSQGMVHVDFDDKSSWEYLFKCYWICLKEKLSLTLDEILQAKNPWKMDNIAGQGPRWDGLCRNVDVINLKRRKINKCPELKTEKDGPKTEDVDIRGGTVEAIANQMCADTKSNDHVVTGITIETIASQTVDDTKSKDHVVMGGDERTKACKKAEDATQYANSSERAAIDVYNINLIYLRRSLMEKLLDDADKFHDRVVGSLVRIRISDNTKKQEFFRLVQVVGTRKASELYIVGTRRVDILLEVLNLSKKDLIPIDRISDQDFSKEECKHLRQSIKYGLIQPFTVGEIQEKAVMLRTVRVKDWLEAELLRLYHLRDRANEQGHRKELRECVEKIDLLSSPEEHQRRLQEVPEVHSEQRLDFHDETEEDNPVSENNPDLGKMGRDLCSAREGVPLNQADPTTLKTCDLNQLMVPSGIASEDSLPFHSEINQSADSSETERIWHYRDPTGNVQGPFSKLQLKKWSSDGHFPADMKIWRMNDNQHSSILLSDVLNGLRDKDPLSLFNDLFSHDVGILSRHDNSSWDNRPNGSSDAVVKENEKFEESQQLKQNDLNSRENSGKQTESERYSSPISEQDFRSLPILGSSKDWDSAAGSSSVADTVKESANNHEVEAELKPSVGSLPDAELKPSVGSLHGLENDNKQSISGIPIQGSLPSWSDLHSQPAYDPPNWPEIVAEDEESVSDLLAEVEAMESRNANGPGTPTSAMNPSADLREGSMDDCFSPGDCLEAAPDPEKTDAVKTTGYVKTEAAPAVVQELHIESQHQVSLDTQKRFGGHSSMGTKVEKHARHRNISSNKVDPDRHAHPPPPAIDVSHRAGSEVTDSRWGQAHENMNRSSGGLSQKNGTSNRGTGHGTSQGNSHTNWRTGQGPGQGNSNWNSSSSGGRETWGSQTRHSGDRISPRDRGYHSGDQSRGRSMYNRQSYGSGGGSSRHPPRGQRVCKFYESGYCKKGSSCSYWHP